MKWQDFYQEIEKHINKFEKDDQEYFNWLEGRRDLWKKFYNYGQFSDGDAGEVIKFLKEWGKMSRVIGKIRRKEGEDKLNKDLIDAVQNTHERFQSLESNRFECLEPLSMVGGEIVKEIIEKIFGNFCNVLKITCPTKIMHMVNPDLFIMWDEEIRDCWGCKASARGYFNFVMRMQIELKELVDDYVWYKGEDPSEGLDALLKDLENISGRSCPITRWLDVYNYTNLFRINVPPTFPVNLRGVFPL